MIRLCGTPQQLRGCFPCSRKVRRLSASWRLASRWPCSSQQQLAVIPGGRRNAKRPRQQNLPRSRLQQVGAANHLGDPHRRVIHHHGKLIGGKIVPPPYQEVAKVLSRHKPLGTEVPVLKLDDLSLRNAETPVCAGCGVSGLAPVAGRQVPG